MAPPARAGEVPIPWAMIMEMTPMVAAVAKELPRRKETAPFITKVSTTTWDDEIHLDAPPTMAGIVPQALQNAVSTPISRNVMRMFRTVIIPWSVIWRREAGAVFRQSP